ncbi:GFA family protein [Sediminispirochaeta bajacaliforniensis]|uniref:GFA family protein n=1 Tax=Sediminispirochaeta bajacaliforniensis TaxID=148 RepID=UPI0003647408|nr:GFA family protein [Sediminispirochaeta bajacaliforniensis]
MKKSIKSEHRKKKKKERKHMKHTGSCLCGEITFEINGDFENFFLCHCSRCRKDTGSAHAANLFSSTAKLRWLSGEDKVRTYQFKSTGHIKSFCPNCGSALPNIQQDGKLLVVPAGSLDSEVTIRPEGHIFMGSRAKWDNDLEKVPRFDKLP